MAKFKQIESAVESLDKQVKMLMSDLKSLIDVINKQSKSQSDLASKTNSVKKATEQINIVEKELERIRKASLKVTKEVISEKEKLRQKTKALTDEVRKEQGTFQKSGAFFRNQAKAVLAAGAAYLGVTKILSGFNKLIKNAITNADKQARAEKQVEQALKSTGNTAGFTAKELKKTASELQKITRFSDEDILKDVTANLLTFTSITNNELKDAQKIILDMSELLGQDLKSSSIQVGKALNDPIKGITALSRVGVSFTDEQKKVIKSLQETGNTAGAQRVILAELNKEFGGQAVEAAKVGSGAYQRFKNVLGDVSETIGNRLLPILNRVSEALIEKLSPQKEIINLYGLEDRKLNILFASLKNTNISQEARNKLIKEINTKYGSYLPNLLTEKSTLQEIETAEKAINKQLKLKIIQQAFQKEINDLLQAELSAKEQLVNAEILAEEAAYNRLAASTEAGAIAAEQQKFASYLVSSLAKSTIDNNDKEIKSTEDKFKRIGELYGIAFAEIEAILNQNTEAVETANDEEIKSTEKKFKTQSEIDAENKQEKLKAYKEYREKLEQQESEADKKLIEKAKEDLTTSLEEQRQIELDAYQKTIDEKAKLEKNWQDAKTQLKVEGSIMALEFTNDLFKNNIDSELSDFQAQQEIQQKLLDERLDKGQISQKQYEKETEALKKKGIIEAAKAEKKKAVLDASLAAIVAVIKQVAATPPPAGIPFIIATGILGAAQVAAAAAKPIPKFKHGTDGMLQLDTTAIVGDGGKPELITTPQGSFISPSTDTMVHLPKGSQVFSGDSPETKAALSGGMSVEMFNSLINEQKLTRKAIESQKQAPVWTRKGLSYRDELKNIDILWIKNSMR